MYLAQCLAPTCLSVYFSVLTIIIVSTEGTVVLERTPGQFPLPLLVVLPSLRLPLPSPHPPTHFTVQKFLHEKFLPLSQAQSLAAFCIHPYSLPSCFRGDLTLHVLSNPAPPAYSHFCMRPYGLQHARLPCPSPTPKAY